MDNKCKIINCIIALLSILVIVMVVILAFNSNEQEKNILTAIANEGDNTQIGITTIKFSENEILIGNAISHIENTDTININENGIYQISYQLYGMRETIGTFNFSAIILVNDTAVNETFNESPILRDNVVNRMTLTSTVFLKLNAGDTVKLKALSIEDISYPTSRIDIEKIY